MKTDPYLDTNCEDSDKLIISKSRNSDLTKRKKANYSYRIFVALCGSRKLNCHGSAKGSRRVRDTGDDFGDDFAIVLRGVLSHKKSITCLQFAKTKKCEPRQPSLDHD